jgi:hypothetical protein
MGCEAEMNRRNYTVKELDDLRRVVEDRVLFGTSFNDGKGRVSGQFRAGEVRNEVEQLVRTHMIAGHTAQDLIDADIERENAKAKYG